MMESSKTLLAMVLPTSLVSVQTLLRFAGLWLLYHLVKALYNISPLHPLSHIPGPKLAAATYFPEFYHDVILFGRYTHQIAEMHRKYGPIVRINPSELHCSDINFSDEIYAVGGRKRNKPVHQINAAVFGGSGFGTIEHNAHRIRRAPLAKFFSRSMIFKLEAEIQTMVQKLCNKLLAESGRNIPIDITVAYSCFTSDAISGYCFGEGFGFLEQQGWYPNFRDPTFSTIKPMFFFRFFPWAKVLIVLGLWFVDFLPTDIALLIKTMQIEMPVRVNKAKTDLDSGVRYERPTVFGSLLESDLPPSEKGSQRLADEAGAVIGAGTETTSWSLSVMTYHLLTKPHILEKLQNELRQAVKDPRSIPSWAVLETLPYLNAVIQEGLRLSYGVSGRTAREAPEEDLLYRGEFNKRPVEYKIPRGYAVGMSAAITHHDETIYPNSHEFIPERWLGDSAQRKEAERGILAFSKGSRGCPGKNLGLCELTLALTALTLRVLPHMSLYETSHVDVAYDYDVQIPMAKKGTKGVRVLIN